jgi:hypothetical protein
MFIAWELTSLGGYCHCVSLSIHFTSWFCWTKGRNDDFVWWIVHSWRGVGCYIIWARRFALSHYTCLGVSFWTIDTGDGKLLRCYFAICLLWLRDWDGYHAWWVRFPVPCPHNRMLFPEISRCYVGKSGEPRGPDARMVVIVTELVISNAVSPVTRSTSYELEMSSSGMWRLVALVGTDVSEERVATVFRLKNSESPTFTARMSQDVRGRGTLNLILLSSVGG